MDARELASFEVAIERLANERNSLLKKNDEIKELAARIIEILTNKDD